MARAATEVPAGYAAVVRLGRGQPGRLAMRSFDQRKRQVRAERRVTGVSDGTPVAEESLRQLLEEMWIEAEAGNRGIHVESSHVTRAFRRVKRRDFSSVGQFHAYLKSVRLTEGEARHRVEIQLLFQRIEELVTEGVPVGHRSVALRRFSEAYLKRWRSKTICRAGLATERCSNGPSLSSESSSDFSEPAPRG